MKHWFALAIPEAELRKLNREQYRQVASWLRHARRMVLMSMRAGRA